MDDVQTVETGSVNAESSVEEIVSNAPGMEAEKPEGSQPSNEQQAKTGEVVKTQELDEKEVESLLSEGKPIPFKRFSQLVKQRNELREKQKELEEKAKHADEVFSNPKVLRTYLEDKGYSKKDIDTYFEQQGIVDKEAVKEEQVNKPSYDLTTVEGWEKRIDDLVGERLSKALDEYDKTRMTKEDKVKFIASESEKAQKLAEEVYNIPFGKIGESEKDPNTAVGKIAEYLKKNPGDAFLGHAKLLKLAMSEEGLKLGEKKGEQKEKVRQKNLKNAALEGDEVGRESPPDSESSIDDIIKWHNKHSSE